MSINTTSAIIKIVFLLLAVFIPSEYSLKTAHGFDSCSRYAEAIRDEEKQAYLEDWVDRYQRFINDPKNQIHLKSEMIDLLSRESEGKEEHSAKLRPLFGIHTGRYFLGYNINWKVDWAFLGLPQGSKAHAVYPKDKNSESGKYINRYDLTEEILFANTYLVRLEGKQRLITKGVVPVSEELKVNNRILVVCSKRRH